MELISTSQMNKLWQQAFVALGPEHKERLKSLTKDSSLVATSPEKLINIVNTKKEDCEKKQWVLFTNKKGENVLLRDVLGKICDWAVRFQKIGDAAVEYVPHAAIPWAIIKALTQVCFLVLLASVNRILQSLQYVQCCTDTLR